MVITFLLLLQFSWQFLGGTAQEELVMCSKAWLNKFNGFKSGK